MFEQNTSLPISGGVILSALVYTGTCLFGLGPLLGERTIKKSSWIESCKTGLQKQIEAKRTPRKVIPKTDCRSMVGWLMPELSQLCTQYGNPDLAGPFGGLQEQQERLRKQAEDKRLSAIAAQSGSRCQCAASIVAQDYAWALHAGSLRLITPPQIQNLNAELNRALYSPHCTGGSAL